MMCQIESLAVEAERWRSESDAAVTRSWCTPVSIRHRGRQRHISRQVNGGKREAERVEAKLRTEAAEGEHRGTGAKTMAELLDVWFEWRTSNGRSFAWGWSVRPLPAVRREGLDVAVARDDGKA